MKKVNVSDKAMVVKSTEVIETVTQAQPHRAKSYRKPVPLELIISHAEKGLTLSEIGKLCGITKASVHGRLKKAGYTRRRLDLFKKHKADILAFKTSQLIEKLDVNKVEVKNTTDLRNIATTVGILYDKERLERGQSTENVAYKDLSDEKSEVDGEIEALEKEIKTLEDK